MKFQALETCRFPAIPGPPAPLLPGFGRSSHRQHHETPFRSLPMFHPTLQCLTCIHGRQRDRPNNLWKGYWGSLVSSSLSTFLLKFLLFICLPLHCLHQSFQLTLLVSPCLVSSLCTSLYPQISLSACFPAAMGQDSLSAVWSLLLLLLFFVGGAFPESPGLL